MSQGQFGHFMCHLTVLEAGDDGKVGLENETSSEVKWVRNFVSGPKKKDNFKPGSNKKLALVLKFDDLSIDRFLINYAFRSQEFSDVRII